MKDYRNYIFDLYGTLVDISVDEADRRLGMDSFYIQSALSPEAGKPEKRGTGKISPRRSLTDLRGSVDHADSIYLFRRLPLSYWPGVCSGGGAASCCCCCCWASASCCAAIARCSISARCPLTTASQSGFAKNSGLCGHIFMGVEGAGMTLPSSAVVSAGCGVGSGCPEAEEEPLWREMSSTGVSSRTPSDLNGQVS